MRNRTPSRGSSVSSWGWHTAFMGDLRLLGEGRSGVLGQPVRCILQGVSLPRLLAGRIGQQRAQPAQPCFRGWRRNQCSVCSILDLTDL